MSESASSAADGSASTRSRIRSSATKPVLTTSASPLTSSARGRVRSVARSQSTPAGGWNAPTRFLPSAVSMAVLPPTAASTIPSSVVGTWTTAIPRSQVAATKPARSVVAPPPTATTASLRVKPRRPSRDHRSAATSAVLAASPSGTGARTTSKPAASRSCSTGGSQVGECTGVDQQHPPHVVAEQGRQLRGDARADDHVVGPVAPDLDPRRRPGHDVIAATTSSATCPVSCRRCRPGPTPSPRRPDGGPPSAAATGRAGCPAAAGGPG